MRNSNWPKAKDRFRTPLDFVQRSYPRLVCSFDAAFGLPERPSIPVKVFNISAAGFMIASAIPLLPGVRGVLQMGETGNAASKILWARECQAGGVFDVLVDVDAVIADLEERCLI